MLERPQVVCALRPRRLLVVLLAVLLVAAVLPAVVVLLVLLAVLLVAAVLPAVVVLLAVLRELSPPVRLCYRHHKNAATMKEIETRKEKRLLLCVLVFRFTLPPFCAEGGTSLTPTGGSSLWAGRTSRHSFKRVGHVAGPGGSATVHVERIGGVTARSVWRAAITGGGARSGITESCCCLFRVDLATRLAEGRRNTTQNIPLGEG